VAREVTGVEWEDGPGGLPFLVVETDRCRARLTPYGAHVCEWTPAGQATSALFLSPRATFAAGKAIRGGVPVCFPWFANHPTDATKPAHGFARTRLWQVADIGRNGDDDVGVVLRLTSDAETRAYWPAEFVATLTVSLGRSLAMTLEVENTGADEIAYESALHTYLTVGDVEGISIHGLKRTRFVDKVDGFQEKTAGDTPIAIAGEVDRVYLDTPATCTVDDPVLGRRIRIEKRHSQATIVWNPGHQKAQGVADIGGEAWQRFVCVETANCGPHVVRLAPRARHAMTARIDVTAQR
jgi:D-hexose-6-phosphate mutarotase